ncbi:hypothetical protein THAOC_28784, partial [Thalassiosira oceanica]
MAGFDTLWALNLPLDFRSILRLKRRSAASEPSVFSVLPLSSSVLFFGDSGPGFTAEAASPSLCCFCRRFNLLLSFAASPPTNNTCPPRATHRRSRVTRTATRTTGWVTKLGRMATILVISPFAQCPRRVAVGVITNWTWLKDAGLNEQGMSKVVGFVSGGSAATKRNTPATRATTATHHRPDSDCIAANTNGAAMTTKITTELGYRRTSAMHLPLLLSLLLLLAATDSVEGFRTSASETRHRPSSALRLSNTPNPFESIQSIFTPKSGSPPSRAIPDAVVDPDYKLAAGFGAAGAATIALDQAGVVGSAFGGFLCLLALLFAVQGTRIRFVFDQDSFELKQVGEGELDDSGENIVVGGKNRWSYESFVNW